MAYRLTDPVEKIAGIGLALKKTLNDVGIETVQDLALYLPYRYEDRSNITTIDQLEIDKPATIKAVVRKAGIQYKGRRTIVRATIEDSTGKLSCIWFNNRFVMNQLKEGAELYFAGKLSDRGMLVQATIERATADTIHTGRLVPFYTQISDSLKIGSLRRILKRVVDNLAEVSDPVIKELDDYPDFITAIKTLHFPENEEEIATARERLALEELLGLIKHSQAIKKNWKKEHQAEKLELAGYDSKDFAKWLPESIPFELTGAQQRATKEIMESIGDIVAMNRMLVGDVGSGKTVVAGLACLAAVESGQNAVLTAPTQILAQQHLNSLKKLLPTINYQLLTTKQSKDFKLNNEPTLYIGTHAVLNHLEKIKPALLIYDEQHRFGVKQRAIPQTKLGTPHLLTMSATPIPRSLMLTLFSHLELSVIDELPANQQPTTTWLVPKKKREESWRWLGRTLQKTAGQALVVCPFIEPSRHENLSNVTAATELVEELKNYYSKNFPELNLGLLHGRLKETAKDKIIAQTFQQEIDILVTTPVVEVGVDLPAANVMIIEGAERFGLASLHQLRGRVGRAGQESFCLLFTSNSNQQVNQRLKSFTETHDGLKLAEQDLENRGAGDLFGFRQSGISDLRFASWANLELIQTAHQTYQNLKKHDWQPLINYQPSLEQSLPGAN